MRCKHLIRHTEQYYTVINFTRVFCNASLSTSDTASSATFGKILRKELTVIGSWMNYSSPWPGQEWETASRLLTERKLSLEPLIAHRGSFESFAQAVRDIARNAMPGKVLLIP